MVRLVERKKIITMSYNSASTNNQYQSTFMPIFNDAEARIKRLVVFAFWVKMPKVMLLFQIGEIIKQVKKDIPANLYNREAYINGLVKSSNDLIKQYNVALTNFERTKKRLIYGDKSLQSIKSPQNLAELMQKQTEKEKLFMWSQAKGHPNVTEYEKEIKKFIDSVSDRPFVTQEPGKKPISLWQKAELDVRYNKQMDMLNELLDKNVELAWISSHPDCSKRCEKWQGKLVSLTKHATMSGFRVGKVDGHWVYSLPDIMAQVDKYGYHNNIICGFNCRHKLHEYIKGSVAPREYSKDEVKKQRAIEQSIRMKERNIRLLKMKANDYKIVNDKKSVKILNQRIKLSVADYKRFCERNGYAWEKYRIDVNDNNIYLRAK